MKKTEGGFTQSASPTSGLTNYDLAGQKGRKRKKKVERLVGPVKTRRRKRRSRDEQAPLLKKPEESYVGKSAGERADVTNLRKVRMMDENIKLMLAALGKSVESIQAAPEGHQEELLKTTYAQFGQAVTDYISGPELAKSASHVAGVSQALAAVEAVMDNFDALARPEDDPAMLSELHAWYEDGMGMLSDMAGGAPAMMEDEEEFLKGGMGEEYFMGKSKDGYAEYDEEEMEEEGDDVLMGKANFPTNSVGSKHTDDATSPKPVDADAPPLDYAAMLDEDTDDISEHEDSQVNARYATSVAKTVRSLLKEGGFSEGLDEDEAEELEDEVMKFARNIAKTSRAQVRKAEGHTDFKPEKVLDDDGMAPEDKHMEEAIEREVSKFAKSLSRIMKSSGGNMTKMPPQMQQGGQAPAQQAPAQQMSEPEVISRLAEAIIDQAGAMEGGDMGQQAPAPAPAQAGNEAFKMADGNGSLTEGSAPDEKDAKADADHHDDDNTPKVNLAAEKSAKDALSKVYGGQFASSGIAAQVASLMEKNATLENAVVALAKSQAAPAKGAVMAMEKSADSAFGGKSESELAKVAERLEKLSDEDRTRELTKLALSNPRPAYR